METWPLMGSMKTMGTISAVYLIIVYVILPKYMENRKPFNLKFVIRCYNVFQIVSCSYIVWKLHILGINHKSTWKCVPTEGEFTKEHLQLNKYQWFFIIFRILEFAETFFFILRKKFNQVSKLHIYHHLSVPWLLIIYLKYSGGPMDLYIGGINSLVHIIMYTYYFLSSFDHLRKLTNVVKPFLTKIQIIQLTIILGHCITAVQPSCKTVHFVHYLQIMNMVFLLTMFGNFYVQSFMKKKKQN